MSSRSRRHHKRAAKAAKNGHSNTYTQLSSPGTGTVSSAAVVFCRKPLFSYTAAIIGMAGIVGLSLFVWAHHMYVSGFAPDPNGPFMLTTEMISVATGLLILVLIGTIWRGRVWTQLPMMAVYAMIWNFIIGGVTGIYLCDVPVDQAPCTVRCSWWRTSTTRS